MSLRSFKAFTNTAPVSPSIPVDQASGVTRNTAFPCTLVNIDGVAAAAGYLQIFDLAVAPTTGVTVPLKSINVAAAGPLPSLYSLLPITLYKGLYVAMSSTEAVYTAVGTNYDVWGEIEDPTPILPSALSVAGDLTTDQDAIEVWTNAQGPKKLYQVDVINKTGAVAYLMGFALNALEVVDGMRPIFALKLIDDNVNPQTFSFGDSNNGLDVFSQTSSFVKKVGCSLFMSTTGDVLTQPGGLDNRIRAYFA